MSEQNVRESMATPTEDNNEVETSLKRGRGRPKKNQASKESAPAQIPSRETALEAAQQYFTLEVMIKKHDQEMKERKKQKTESGKVVKLYFEGNSHEETLGQIECKRKSKKSAANMEKVRQLVEDEILADPLRKGATLIQAISARIEDEEEETEVVSINSNKEALEAALGI